MRKECTDVASRVKAKGQPSKCSIAKHRAQLEVITSLSFLSFFGGRPMEALALGTDAGTFEAMTSEHMERLKDKLGWTGYSKGDRNGWLYTLPGDITKTKGLYHWAFPDREPYESLAKLVLELRKDSSSFKQMNRKAESSKLQREMDKLMTDLKIPRNKHQSKAEKPWSLGIFRKNAGRGAMEKAFRELALKHAREQLMHKGKSGAIYSYAGAVDLYALPYEPKRE